jgi:hypothetical protein
VVLQPAHFLLLTSCFKIKCNRTRPTCEACQVFNCPCIYGMLACGTPNPTLS